MLRRILCLVFVLLCMALPAALATETDLPSDYDLPSINDLPETLYYDPAGGENYHFTADCAAVEEFARPLTPFPRAWLSQTRFSVLRPCTACAMGDSPVRVVKVELPEAAEQTPRLDPVFTWLKEHRGLPFRAKSVFNYVLEAALLGSILITLTFLLRGLLGHRLSSRALCILWALCALRILLPIALPNPLMNELMPTWSFDSAARPVAEQFLVRMHDTLSELMYRVENSVTLRSLGLSAPLSRILYFEVVYGFYGWTAKWYLIAYAVIALLVFTCGMIRHTAARRRLIRRTVAILAPEAQQHWWSIYVSAGAKVVPVRRVEGLAAPCVMGLKHPFIALPAGLSPEDCELALRREVLHLRRRTALWSLMRLLCVSLQWFNPFVWIAARLSRQDMESACDQLCAQTLDNDRRPRLAEALAERVGRTAPALCTLASVITQKARCIRARQRRLTHTSFPAALAVIVVLVMTLIFLASFFVKNTGFSSLPY